LNFAALIDEFEKHDGRYAFGVPGGGESLVMLDALENAGGRFIATGHETTAALMAGSFSRLTKTPSAAISIKGPGFANLFPGLLSNSYEGYPQLSFSEAYAPGTMRSHKQLDHEYLCHGIVRAFHRFDPGPGFLTRCWADARSEFPGPVHVDLTPRTERSSSGPLPSAPTGSLSELGHRLKDKTRPALIVGSIALRSSWRETLQALEIPVFTTVAAKGAIPETGRFAAGIYTGDGKALSPEKVILPHADCVVAIGVRSGEILSVAPPHAETIAVDRAGVAAFPPDLTTGRVDLTDEELHELLGLLQEIHWGEVEVAGTRENLRERIFELGWSPAEALRTAQEKLPKAIHVMDTGNFTVLAEHLLTVGSEEDVLGTPNGRFMGAGLGYALGACLNPQARRVILWIGDGGIRAFFGELALAIENNWPLIVAVMKDGHYGSIRGRAIEKGLSTAPLALSDRPLAKTAEAMGMRASRVESLGGFENHLSSSLVEDGPSLVECFFDSEAYNATAGLLR
jgi:acetolactate synthase I/II/III large subunit